jgi:hypothetical protein
MSDAFLAIARAESLAAQLQATLNLIPAHTWYAAPSGALAFVSVERLVTPAFV